MPVSLIDTHNKNLFPVRGQRGCFYAAGRYWMFYREQVAAEGTARLLKHRSRVDPAGAWGDEFTVWDSGANGRLVFALWFDGTYVLLTYTMMNSGCPIYFRRGVPNAGGTITWDPIQTVRVADTYYMDIGICRENGPDGHIWITISDLASPYDWYAWESTDNAGTGWTQRLVNSFGDYGDCHFVVPMEDAGTVYVVRAIRAGGIWYLRGRRWNGAGWDALETIQTGMRGIKVCSRGNEIYVIYFQNGVNAVLYGRKRLFVGAWQTQRTITNAANIAMYSTLSWEEFGGMLYVYYVKATSIYRQEADGTLNDPTWGNETLIWARTNAVSWIRSFGWCQNYPAYCKFMVTWIEVSGVNQFLYESPDEETVICPCFTCVDYNNQIDCEAAGCYWCPLETPPCQATPCPVPPPPPEEEGIIWSHRSPIEEANRRRRRYWRRGRAGRR